MSSLTRKLRRLRGADRDKFFKTMRLGRNRKSGSKGMADARVFDAESFFDSYSDLPKPPHKLGLELKYHATKGWRWRRDDTAKESSHVS